MKSLVKKVSFQPTVELSEKTIKSKEANATKVEKNSQKKLTEINGQSNAEAQTTLTDTNDKEIPKSTTDVNENLINIKEATKDKKSLEKKNEPGFQTSSQPHFSSSQEKAEKKDETKINIVVREMMVIKAIKALKGEKLGKNVSTRPTVELNEKKVKSKEANATKIEKNTQKTKTETKVVKHDKPILKTLDKQGQGSKQNIKLKNKDNEKQHVVDRKRKYDDFELVCHLCFDFKCKDSEKLAKHIMIVHGPNERNLTKDLKNGVMDKRIKQEFICDI